jgi:hypothetical protein
VLGNLLMLHSDVKNTHEYKIHDLTKIFHRMKSEKEEYETTNPFGEALPTLIIQ